MTVQPGDQSGKICKATATVKVTFRLLKDSQQAACLRRAKKAFSLPATL